MRATNRPGAQLLGANGRDDGPIVSLIYIIQNYGFIIYINIPCTRDMINKDFFFVRSHHALEMELIKFH